MAPAATSAAPPAARWAPQRPAAEEPGGCSEEDGSGHAQAPRPYEPLGPAAPRGAPRAAAAALAAGLAAAAGSLAVLAALAAPRQALLEGPGARRPLALEEEVADGGGADAEAQQRSDRERPATGCINWRHISLHDSLNMDTKEDCVQACREQHGCVAANFQSGPCSGEQYGGVGSGACYLNTDLCAYEKNSCWELTEINQVSHTVPWSLKLQKQGCKNFKEDAIALVHVWNVDQCGKKCQDHRDCVSFHYQDAACPATEHGLSQGHGEAGRGACYLLRSLCDIIPNPCWDGYYMSQGARASELHLTQAAAAGATEIYLDSIHGLKVTSTLMFNSELGSAAETKEIIGFHPVVLAAPLERDYAVGATILVRPVKDEVDETASGVSGPPSSANKTTNATNATGRPTAKAGDLTNTEDPGEITEGPIGYELYAENTGKRWCRGPAAGEAGEEEYTSGNYEHIVDVTTVQQCANLCTERPWCLGFNYKPVGGAPGFEEKTCQLVSQEHICKTDVTNLTMYTKGVYVCTPGEVCNPQLTREQCDAKVKLFGETLQNSDDEDAPAGCFRSAQTGMFYWSDTGTGTCSRSENCLCA